MTQIPMTNNVVDVQQAIREIWAVLNPLASANIDLKGRRVINAHKSISPSDYVIQDELGPFSYNSIRNRLKQEGLDGFPGVLADPQKAVTKLITATDPSVLGAGSLYYDPVGNRIGLATGTTVIWLNTAIRVDTFANRGVASAYKNQLFGAKDKGGASNWLNGLVVWQSCEISTGVWGWVYICGMSMGGMPITGTWASLILGQYDVGLLHFTTDYGHSHRWNGSAWEFAPGDGGSGYIIAASGNLQGGGPGGAGWTTCTGGSATITLPSGIAGSATVPNLNQADEVFLTGKSSMGTVQAAESAKWSTGAAEHKTDDAAAHTHIIMANSMTSGGVSAIATVCVATPSYNVASGSHTHQVPNANVDTHADGAHNHNLSDATAKLRPPKAGDGGVPQRCGLIWWMRQ